MQKLRLLEETVPVQINFHPLFFNIGFKRTGHLEGLFTFTSLALRVDASDGSIVLSILRTVLWTTRRESHGKKQQFEPSKRQQRQGHEV